MFRVLGWVNAGLLLIMVLPFILTRANRLLFEGKNETLRAILKVNRKVHKPSGVLLLIIAFIHGYLAMGRVALHTGTVLYVSLFLTAILGGWFWQKKNKQVFQIHKLGALISVLLFLLHWLAPGAFRAFM